MNQKGDDWWMITKGINGYHQASPWKQGYRMYVEPINGNKMQGTVLD